MGRMPSEQKGTRVQFRLRTLLWGTMWFALLLAVCIRHQQAATRQREVMETLREAPFPVTPAARSPQPATAPGTVNVSN